MKKCITLAMLVFSALSPLSAQNAEAVKAYLGAYRFDNVAPPAGPMEFVFSRTTLNRQADGKATYKSLLKTGYFQDSGNYGTLSGVRITEGGKLVPVERYTPAVDPSGTLTLADVGSSALKAPTMPDSLAIANGTEAAIRKVDAWKSALWSSAAPIWRLVMYFFMSFLPILLMVGGVLRYLAKTAAGESAVNLYGTPLFGGWLLKIHQSTAGALLVIKWSVTVVVLINTFLWLIWLGLDLWLVAAIWFVVLRFAEAITNWIVPDVRVVSNGFAKQSAAGNLPRLG